jgi:Protein of unknown function (DUF3768)
MKHRPKLNARLAGRGPAFVDRALAAVRAFDAFSADNDPYGEHDFGIFELDGVTLNWKIYSVPFVARRDCRCSLVARTAQR